MNAKHKIFDPRTFDDVSLNCPHCGWIGRRLDSHVAGFYGISKFKEVLCPNCNEYLGNLSREQTYGAGGRRLDSQNGPI